MTDQNPPEQPSFNQPAAGSAPPPPQPSGPPAPTVPAAPAQPAATAPTPRAALPGSSEGVGFLTALFDFSFTKFVTPMLVRFVYLLATAALVATWLVFLFTGFARDALSGLVVLVFGPVLLVIYLAVIRMTLEFYLSVVRMSEDVHRRLPQG